MSCLLSIHWPEWLAHLQLSESVRSFGAAGLSSFGLIAAAEIGDKSQLVCMTLAARYRAWPVVFGAGAAFAVLNLAAVVFGAAAARWIPEEAIAIAVIALFSVFGLRALFAKEEEEDESVSVATKTPHSVFVTAFLLIFVAEFGDKTQLAVAGMSVTLPPQAVWLGGTLALLATSMLGAWAGSTVLQRLPIHWLHRLSGLAFLGFAAVTAWHALPVDWLSRVLEWVNR